MVQVVGWLVAGGVTAIGGILTRHFFKKYTHLEARVSDLEGLQSPPAEEGPAQV